MNLLKPLVITVILIIAWQIIIIATNAPHYILPSPLSVGRVLLSNAQLLIDHALVTFIEIILGLIIGTILGCISALVLTYYRPTRQWLMPILVISQAIPVFALAPILVLWLGYGIISKVAMAILIIYFPVTASFFDGLKTTNAGYLDLAHTMNASKSSILFKIKIPAALPAFASGLRVAAAVAPIGAIVGEWVGASEGLGFLMLHANGRMQTDLMFGALLVLAIIALIIYYLVDYLLKYLLYWIPTDNEKK